MRNAKRILLVASVTVLVVGSAEAGLFGRKAKAPEPVRAASAMSLTAIESDASRVVLRTSGTPAYTSYSPSPDVFIVDLTATSRPAEVGIPSPLPPAVTTVTAEEVTEMGSRLTRVTFRLSQPLSLQATAAESSVVINFPAVAAQAAAPESVAAIASVAMAETTRIEPVAEQPRAAVPEPAVIAEPIAPRITEVVPEAELPKATKLQNVETSRSGESLEVRIAGDGAMTYKAFRLENPARLVIDVDGVNNRVAKNTIAVNDSVVQRVRVAQFKTGAQPVARVVIDLASKSEYTISNEGKNLRVAFGGAQLAPMKSEARPAVAELTVTPAPPPAPRVQQTASRQPAPADIPSQVPAIAEEWKMPPSAPAKASKGARSV
ncbi:MAG TPA: AMIN domain-containing protein, partial [Thermoanaerobaculia bacterium]